MKKELIFFVLILGLISFASALSHPICNPGNDPSIHGVYINGACYDCGENDLVCPENYGADCGAVADVDCAVTPEAFFSLSNTSLSLAPKAQNVNLPEGKDFYLVVRNMEGPDGTSVTFEVYEDDSLILGDNKLRTLSATQNAGKAIAKWHANEDDLDNLTNTENEIYFTATSSQWSKMYSSPLSLLNITWIHGGPVITQCSNYTDNVSCKADDEDVGSIGIVTPRVDGSCYYDITGNCSWNGTICQQTTNELARTGNPIGCGTARGSCVYDSTEETGDCSVEDFFTISYTSTADPIRCAAWETGAIPCPAQVRLPFFSLLNIIASISIISVIYAFLLKKKESL